MAEVMSFSFENEGNGQFGDDGGLHNEEEESFHLNDSEAESMIDGGADDDTFSGLGDPNFDFNSSPPPYPSSILSENLFGTESAYAPFAADSSGQAIRSDHHHAFAPLTLPPNPNVESDSWQRRLDSQVDVYKAQTRDFHRLVATQKLLTGVDPLTGQAVDTRATVKSEGVPAPRPAIAVPGMKPELLAVFLQFLKDYPKPTKKDLKQLLPQVNMGEKETIEALKKVRKAKQDHEKRAKPQETTKATESPESRKEATLNQQLLDIVDRQGGVSEPQKMIKLQKIMAEEKSPDAQSLLLNVVSNSRRLDLKKVFIDNDGLVVLKAWLIQAIKEKNTQLVRQLLKVIYTLPMTVETLQKSGMGKLIKKLENHPTEVVKKWAVRIMNSWKDVVLNASKKAESSSTKKDVADEKAAAEKARLDKKEKEVSPTAARGMKRTREVTPAAPKLAAKPGPQLKISASEDFDDLIAGPAKPRPVAEKRKLTGLIPDHVKRRRHAVQLIEEDVTAPHPIAKGVGSYKSKPLSADDIKKAKSSGAVAASPLSPPLVSTRRDSDPGKRQRDDDEEAFPDSADVSYDEGEGRASKKKKKRVSWASDEKLVQVKMFEKYLPSLMGNAPRPVGSFAAMMQLEKQREKEVADQQRKHEEGEWQERFEKMTATVPWKAPQLLYMSPEYKVAMGEKSKEMGIQRERQSKILGEYYSREEDIPPTPTEPAEAQEEYDDASVPLIPLDEMYTPPPQQQQQQLPPPLQQQQQQQQQLPPHLAQPMHQPQPNLGGPPMGAPYGAPMMGAPPAMGGPIGQPAGGNMEQALNALLANPQALGSLLGDNQALSSLLASLPQGVAGGPPAGAPFMGGLPVPNINLAQQGAPMGGPSMGPPPSAGMMYNPSQPTAPLPPHLMQPQQQGYPPRDQQGPPLYGGGMGPGGGPGGMPGMGPPPFGGGGGGMPPQQYGGPPPQHGGYPMGGPPGGGYGGPGGHGGPGGGGYGGHTGGGHGGGGGGYGGPSHAGGGGGGNWGRDDRKQRLCSFFNSPQGCRNGEACPFQHVVGASAKFPHERREERERERRR